MQTSTSTPSKKRAPIASTVKAAAAKPLSKAKVTAIPKPTKAGRGSARTLYSYSGKAPEGKTPQMNALIATCVECKKSELDIKYKAGLHELIKNFIKKLENKKNNLINFTYSHKLMKLINNLYNV